MIFFNSLLAKCFGEKERKTILCSWFFFTRYKYLEVWKNGVTDTCKAILGSFSLTLIPALILSLLFSWWCIYYHS